MNRSQRRLARAELRAAGCRCRPELHSLAVDGDPLFVLHESGCPLGDAVLDLNRLGLVPALHSEALDPCTR